MPGKHPIEAFYVAKEKPQRNVSQKSTRHLLSNTSQVFPLAPSFTYIDGLSSYDIPFGRISFLSSLNQRENSSDSSSRESFLSKNSLRAREKSKKINRRRYLPILIAFLVAICLIAIVILLGITLSKKNGTTVSTTLTTMTTTTSTSVTTSTTTTTQTTSTTATTTVTDLTTNVEAATEIITDGIQTTI